MGRGHNNRQPLACEDIRFSSLFAVGDVSRKTSPAAKSREKRMFSQANATSSDVIHIQLPKWAIILSNSQKNESLILQILEVFWYNAETIVGSFSV